MTDQRAADEFYHGMKPGHVALFVAGRAVGYATAFLDGRDTAERLHHHADSLMAESLITWDGTDAISDPTRLLIITMWRTSRAEGARADRWRSVLATLVHLVMAEVRALNAELAQ